MLNTPRSRNGMVTTPHHLASQTGMAVLRDGGTAIEAAVAAAATLAVVYPHMTGLGGDGFWLIAVPGRPPIGIDACGSSGADVNLEFYLRRGLSVIPRRGALAANSVAGTISGWHTALEINRSWGGRMPLSRLLEDAIDHAANGIIVTRSQANAAAELSEELRTYDISREFSYVGSASPSEGAVIYQPALAQTLRQLATRGLEDFYRGALAKCMAADLRRAGAPLTADDLARQHAEIVMPLSVDLRLGTVFNLPPPTQGMKSLMILALLDRLELTEGDGFDHIHSTVEATKRASLVLDRRIGEPRSMSIEPASLLTGAQLDALAKTIDRTRAMPWLRSEDRGDTVWLGIVDRQGRAVSFIQSLFFEFGSGLLLPETGVLWQNRGCSFDLIERGATALYPGHKPFHTLNPAFARFADGREMIYGTIGGEGQPEIQATIFSRYAFFGQCLQAATTAPRWLLGSGGADGMTTLKLESRIPQKVVSSLEEAGHKVEIVADYCSLMGHAGAIVRRPDRVLEGATDPRSDGSVASW